jgi:hypothetical protein
VVFTSSENLIGTLQNVKITGYSYQTLLGELEGNLPARETNYFPAILDIARPAKNHPKSDSMIPEMANIPGNPNQIT